jgi:hypothetical protein
VATIAALLHFELTSTPTRNFGLIWSSGTGLGSSTTTPGWCRPCWTGSPIAAMSCSSRLRAIDSGRVWPARNPALPPMYASGLRAQLPRVARSPAEWPCRHAPASHRHPIRDARPRYPHYATPFPGPLSPSGDYEFSIPSKVVPFCVIDVVHIIYMRSAAETGSVWT